MDLKKLNRQQAVGIAVISILFAFMLVLNFWTPYIADDYAYMFVFGRGDKLTNFGQLFPSIYAHAFRMNGRLAPHFLVQLFMLIPKGIFNVLNAGMFCFLFWQMIRNAGSRMNRWSDSVLFIGLVVAYWYFIPAFGQVTLWCDGSWNYLWAMGFSMIFMAPYIKLYYGNLKMKSKVGMSCFALFSLFFGDYSENLSFAAISGAVLIILYVKFYEKRSVPAGLIASMALAMCGYVFMYICPAQLQAKAGTGGIRGMIKGFYDCIFYYVNNCKWLIILWGILMVISFYKKIAGKTILLSVLFFLLSLVANFIYMVASYYPERCMCGAIILIMEAIVILLVGLREQESALGIWIVAIIISVTGLLKIVEGTVDIHSTYRQSLERFAYIEECQILGERDIYLKPYVYTTKYSPAYQLRDLAEESDTWPNQDIAAYYGFETVNRQQ